MYKSRFAASYHNFLALADRREARKGAEDAKPAKKVPNLKERLNSAVPFISQKTLLLPKYHVFRASVKYKQDVLANIAVSKERTKNCRI